MGTLFTTSDSNPSFNGIVRDIEGDEEMTEYTDEAQDFFNFRYDYWWDFLYNQKIGDDE